MTALIQTVARAAVVALAVASVMPALAGGDDYDASQDTEDKGPAYFGFVRDLRGSPVLDARVVLRPKTAEPVTLKTNVLGLYRSHIGKEVRPDDVEVSCEKAGYKQAGVVRRPGTNDRAVETTLQRL
jgi:hypothetical protein